MSVAATRRQYARDIGTVGEIVGLRRETADSAIEVGNLRARVTGFRPEELASGVDQGARKVILLAEDVERAVALGLWPATEGGGPAIVKNDRIVVRGAPLNVEAIDDSTRRLGGVLMAYEITATGY
ncbi:MAG: hypothetical protein DI565_00655 [Ancylobacter novellus]|uniref:Uncharacterized protein n=1 Tax=Ancylobacter novellus TaxID=921 RepID=A0A2W5KQG1_ANCNO|nr:MAG: hypothetical protein DI565_00655 [Ancylobacter novellus]